MEEIWKDKKDYEEHYQVSNCGRVKSIKFGKERILKPVPNSFGYLFVNLCKDGKVKAFTVHRLVAEAFLDNPNNLSQVNHKDENKLNNSVENLEWCDAKYNVNYGTAIERRSKTRTNGIFSKKVYQYTLDGEFGREWPSTKECGRNGYNQGHVAACCRGVQNKHKGFKWSYKKLGE